MRVALAANRRYGNPSVVAYANFGLAYGATLGEDIAAQRTHLAEALAGMDAGGIVERADWLATAALLAVREGRYHAGLRLIGASWAYARHRGGPVPRSSRHHWTSGSTLSCRAVGSRSVPVEVGALERPDRWWAWPQPLPFQPQAIHLSPQPGSGVAPAKAAPASGSSSRVWRNHAVT